MVISEKQRSAKKPAKQGVAEDAPEPIKIRASTPYDFDSKNLTAYGGLLPVATMLEKLKFQQLVEETLTVKRVTRAMPWYQFVLSMVLALYVGFSRLHHLRFLARDPMLVGILKVLELPPQCTFWRFLASLHLTVAQQLVEVQRQMRQRVWEAANVKLSSVTFDTDTTVHTVYGKQMGARKSYNPKNKGKKSFQPPADVSCGNQRVRRRRIAQRRSPHGDADRQAFRIGDDHRTERREGGLRASRLWFLLLGSSADL